MPLPRPVHHHRLEVVDGDTVEDVHHQDLQTLLDRLDRISRAIEIGCESLARTRRIEVSSALVDTCWEAVRLGHQLVRRLAYDDVWSDLELLHHRWRAIEAGLRQARTVELSAADPLDVAREVVGSLEEIIRAVAAIDAAQVQATARPRDPQAVGRVNAAIDDLEAAADRQFMASLDQDVHGRLDASMALLTTIAARAARERATISSRRS